MRCALIRLVLVAAVVCSTAAVSLAQQTTSSSETKAFEILAVDGNVLVVRLPEGTRELTVPDDFRFDVNGRLVSVRELEPGMRGTATITTRTTVTPVTVTEVKNGTVVQVAGSTIIVRTDEGFQSFTQGDVDKRGVKIMRSGEPAQVSDFRPGDQLTATIITSMPPRVLTERDVQAALATSGAAAGRAPAASASPASPASSASSASAGRTAAGASRTLPKTASSWPLLGFVSILSLALGLSLTVTRRFAR